ncbi:MAG: J domain-containing protein [Rhizobiales bacterium]|nr:J domain-containing protein [Hyphomicrobiales bacterium]
MRDPYDVLGLKRNASEADIKKAYRRLAKKFHPDANAGDAKAAQQFSDASAAYDFLKDADKRKAYDSGEIDADGNPKMFAYGRGQHPGHGAGGGGRPFGGFASDDIFADLFSGLRGSRQGPFAQPEPEIHYTMGLPLADMAKGAKRRVTLGDGRTIEVTIPRGVQDGQVIRLRGQGPAGMNGAPGDVMITVRMEPDQLFERDGNNLRLTLPITLYEAVLGAKVRVPTMDGSVELNIPASSSGGRVLRLKGKGIAPESGPAGDLYVTLKIVLPPADLELETFLRKRSITKPYSVRGPEFD